MNQDTLMNIIKQRHQACLSTLDYKSTIYSPRNDRLSNFKDVASMNQTTPQSALWSMVSKHIIAVRDMILSGKVPSGQWIEEHLGDIHNYMFLLEAIWREK